MALTLEQRFWAKVRKSSGCWEWTGHRNRGFSYGSIFVLGSLQYAHRVSWMLHNGPIPAGLSVLHRCDNRPCVRPDHLFLGTYADNARDMSIKGRARGATGERNHSARLRRDDLPEIRRLVASGLSQRETGRRFGVSHTAIQNVLNNKTWRGSK